MDGLPLWIVTLEVGYIDQIGTDLAQYLARVILFVWISLEKESHNKWRIFKKDQ